VRIAALVLAAGGGSRFGGGKMLARLHDRPVLQHVLDAVATLGPESTVVVLGDDAREVEAAIAWRGERRVRNPDPERGLASSLQIGISEVAVAGPKIDAVLILLGDQPRVRPDVMRALVESAGATDRPVVVPRYPAGGGGNPALVRRAAWELVGSARGDRGLGPLLADRPDLVLQVEVAGSNPDVDTAEDLAALTLE